MKPWLVAVPSYKRPWWKSLDYLTSQGLSRDRIHLFLNTEKEKRLYEKKSKGCHIHVTGEYGIVNTRTHVMKAMDGERYVFLDDDAKDLHYVNDEGKLEPRNFVKLTDKLFARPEQPTVFGFAMLSNPYFLKDVAFKSEGKYLGRSYFGIDARSGFRVKFRAPFAEDLEIALTALARGLTVLRFNRYVMRFDHYVKGGCEEINHLEGLQDVNTYRNIALRFQKKGVDIRKHGMRALWVALTSPEKWKGFKDAPKKITKR